MIFMTFQAYERECALYEKVREDWLRDPYWPSQSDIDMFYDEPDQWMRVACCISTICSDPKNPAEAKSLKLLRAFINDLLVLVSPEDMPEALPSDTPSQAVSPKPDPSEEV